MLNLRSLNLILIFYQFLKNLFEITLLNSKLIKFTYNNFNRKKKINNRKKSCLI